MRLGALAPLAMYLPFSSQDATGNSSSTPSDNTFLDELQRATFEFFWQEASPSTGQVKDRALLNGNDSRKMSSIAATGFGLAALCIGDRHFYRKSAEISERVKTTLRFICRNLPHVHASSTFQATIRSSRTSFRKRFSTSAASAMHTPIISKTQ